MDVLSALILNSPEMFPVAVPSVAGDVVPHQRLWKSAEQFSETVYFVIVEIVSNWECCSW